MNIVFVNSKGEVISDEKNCDNLPIPRKGEKVNAGFSPSPAVDDIIYDYNRGLVMVVLNTPFQINRTHGIEVKFK